MDNDIVDPWLAIHDRGDADLALAFAHLFWPVFVERRGCVLLEHRAVDSEITTWLEATGGDLERVEAMLNHVHLWDEFPAGQSDLEDERLLGVARAMQRSWRAALADQFPGREFSVTLHGPDDDYGPTLYATRSPRSHAR